MKNTKKKGFTIVELVIVIAVIAILAAVAIPTFTTVIEKANASAVLQEGKSIFDNLYAQDMSDGVLDAKDGKTALTLPTNVTYTVGTGATYPTFTYTNTDKGYTAKLDTNNKMVVEKVTSGS